MEPIEAMTFEETIADAKARYEPWLYYFEVLHPWAQFLEGKAYNVTSQNGEDGLIAAIFDKIGTTSKWCFEVGAADGVQISNTWILRQHGWNAILMETDQSKFMKAWELKRDNENILLEKVTGENINFLLGWCDAPKFLDLGVIDVDGQDWHIWNGMTNFRPRLMLVEFSSDTEPIPPIGGDGQAGIKEIRELGENKGYVAVCRTNCNLFFIDRSIINADAAQG